MKVNFIMPGLGDSGGMKVVYKYAKLLRNLNVNVKIYSAILPPTSYKFSSKLANHIHQLYCLLKTFLFVKDKLDKGVTWVPMITDKYIRKADITIATAWPTAYQVNKLSEKCGKKAYFIQGYEVWDNEAMGKKSYELPLEHIVIAKWINDILVNELHVKSGYIVRNGIDTQDFVPSKTQNHSKSVSCLMLYHQLPQKGIEDGIAAYKIIKNRYPQVTLNMFGMFNDPRISLVDHYYKSPQRSQLIKLYQKSDIFIYPSREEGWGLTPLEAMACGCAVVGTMTGCMLELGVSGENALLNKPRDINTMANNIEILVENNKLRKEISMNGRTTVEKLSWSKSARTLKDILNSIVNS